MSAPELEPWVDALRADLPDAQARERLRKRLLAAGVMGATASAVSPTSAAAGAGGAALPSVAAPGLSAKLLAASWTIKLAVATCGLALGAVAVVLPRMLAVSNRPKPALAVRASVVPRALFVQAPVEREPRAPQSQSQPASPPALRGVPTLRAKPSGLGEETRLLGHALRALRRGDSRAARRWLQMYDRRFPNGALAPERARLLQGEDHD